MNKGWKQLKKNTERIHSSRDVLYEIEQTIAELEIYLKTNPEDEIAMIQYQQFLDKRKGFRLLWAEAYEQLSLREMQA